MSATDPPTPRPLARSAAVNSDLRPGQQSADAQGTCAGAESSNSCPDQSNSDAHAIAVGASPSGRHSLRDSHHKPASEGGAAGQSMSEAQAGRVGGTALLQLASASLDDVEKTRVQFGNRLEAIRREAAVYTETPEYARLTLIYKALCDVEHQATLELQREVRKHPLYSWIADNVGIGEKQGARLLAAIDDPLWNHHENRPRRGPAELWAFCGYRPDQRKRRGEHASWNHAAKMRARLIADSCIKQANSPYRPIYDAARASWADRDTTDLHKHHHALRCVAKAVLRDLFIAAKAAA